MRQSDDPIKRQLGEVLSGISDIKLLIAKRPVSSIRVTPIRERTADERHYLRNQLHNLQRRITHLIETGIPPTDERAKDLLHTMGNINSQLARLEGLREAAEESTASDNAVDPTDMEQPI